MGDKRQRSRIASRVDEFPQDIQALIISFLSDVTVTYEDIAVKITEMGYPISKSSVGRYAIKHNKIQQRIKEAIEQTRVIVEAAKDNNNFDAASATTAMITQALAKNIAFSQEEIENLPADKAVELAIKIERSATYREKFKQQYKDGAKKALEIFTAEINKELSENHPELLEKLIEIAENVAKHMEDK